MTERAGAPVEPSARRTRLLAVCTHPIQYLAPLFRVLTERRPEIDFEVLYITRPTPEQQGQGFGSAFEWDVDLMGGYRSHTLREPSISDNFTRWGGLDAPGIGAAIAARRPDVVLIGGWNCRGLVRALLACNKRGIPVLYRGDTTLWQRPLGLKAMVWSTKNRILLHRFSGFLAVGKRARIFLRENGVPDARIVDSPHAVDGARIRGTAGEALTPTGRAQMRAALGLQPTDFVVLFVGKLEPRKNPEAAVRAVAELGPQAVLAVCGSGELQASCEELASTLGARVAWLGFRNQQELPPIYASADVLVLPSVSETWGLAVNEAMAVGTPCVVSDAVGCAPDLIDPGLTGDVFPAGRSSFLVEALRRFRTSNAARIGTASRVREKVGAYSLERAADGIAELTVQVAHSSRTLPKREKRRRVLALCDGMVVLGGMERRTTEILDYAASSGAEVHCIIGRDRNTTFRIAHRIECSLHSWSGTRDTVGLFSEQRSLAWLLRAVADVLSSSLTVIWAAARRRPVCVFLWSFGSAIKNWPALLALRSIGLRVVLRSGGAPAPGSRQRFLWKWLVDPAVTLHVAISEFVAHELVAAGVPRTKVRVIRNAMPSRPAELPSKEEPVPSIIYVGQVIPEKGIIQFLEALEILLRRGIPVASILIGRFDGWEHPSHAGHKASVAAKLSGFPHGVVTVLGEREDVVTLMQAASIHCCPSQESLREGLGQVVLEAKAAGIPSVVTPSGALPEMVRHRQDGWVCAGFGPEEIAEGLAYFLVDTEARRAAAREALSWSDPAFAQSAVREQWREALRVVPGSADA